MNRTRITLEAVAERKNLTEAFYRAAKGKRHRRYVQVFMMDFENNLSRLGSDIRAARLPYGRFRAFQVHDPKRRLIHAACFEDRIFHHALMNLAGPVLERTMTSTSYACRVGKGVHKAVVAVQQHLRQYAWYVKIDISGYFASIDHERLLQVLMCRFKGKACEAQWRRVLASHGAAAQRGLPIGSLTSQYCANYYLDGLDRWLAGLSGVRASVRYMDDIIWWCDSQQASRDSLHKVRHWLEQERDLQIKPSVQVQPSKQGVTYCGFRILRGAVRLSRRRKQRYQQRRLYWEQMFRQGAINAAQLQLAYASVHAITAGTDSLAWRQENLRRHPPLAV